MIRVSVGIIRLNDKILVNERPKDKTYHGYWEFPGGKIEPNESSEAALKRELYEELGIEIVSPVPWFNVTHQYPDKTVFLEIWLVDSFNGTPFGKEGQIIKWVDKEEMAALNLLEGNFEILEAIKKL